MFIMLANCRNWYYSASN